MSAFAMLPEYACATHLIDWGFTVPALEIIWAGGHPQIEHMKVSEYCFRLRCDHFSFSDFILMSSFVCIFGIELIFLSVQG